MHQRRISWINGIAIAILLVASGIIFALGHAELWPPYSILLAGAFLGVGLKELYHLMYTANDWNFNTTPHRYDRVPRGTWVVMSASVNKRVRHDDAVYVTIAETPACDRSLSALRLPSEWVKIEDYTRIVNGKQPLGISTVGRVAFTWPPQSNQ